MKKHSILITALSMCILAACTGSGKYEYPFQNPALSPEKRADNLLSLLTVDEKISMLVVDQPAIGRLGIPAFGWGNEACHGIRQKDVTVFPQSIALAATFDKEQNYEIFSAISDEARATWNLGYGGISFWTPNINIVRDPRWGRSQETYGEDPYLTGVMGCAVVNGLQGDDPHYLKTAACAKHYAVHSGPEPLRHRYNPSVSDRDLYDTYLPAFKALVQKANVSEVMCAYTAFEGKPCCASNKLLVDILRNKWGFKGRKEHVVVDTLGLPMAVAVHEANLHDSKGAPKVIEKLEHKFPRLTKILADGGYHGTLGDWVSEKFGWTVEVVLRPNECPTKFPVLPKRWIVERSFAWLENFRRLTIDYEFLVDTAEAMVQLAFTQIMLNKFFQ